MESMDGATFGQKAVRLGLVTEADFRDALEVFGSRNPPLEDLVPYLERKGLMTPWQTRRLRRGETDGYFLGGYRLLYKISAGTFGKVYRGDDPATGRIVAVKVLRGRWSEDQSKVDQFLREGKLGLTLDHPNIVKVLAISHDKATGQYYIAMEFVEGGNLREILKIRKRLRWDEALQITKDAASGLAYAFSRGVTHRDIKPSNLLISTTKQTKLVDFGLAQLYSGEQDGDKVD